MNDHTQSTNTMPLNAIDMAREIHAALPGSQLVIIPSAAHLSNIEQPAAFTQAMLGFLEHAGK